MKTVRNTLETITQCVLLPGVEMKFEDVVTYLNQGLGGVILQRVKSFRL